MTRTYSFNFATAARTRAFHALEKAAIIRYWRDYGTPAERRLADRWDAAAPGDAVDVQAWRRVHKVRVVLKSFSDEDKAVSRAWLQEHGE